MPELANDLDLRVTHVEDELRALVREVEGLREELRSLARLVERGDIPGAEAS